MVLPSKHPTGSAQGEQRGNLFDWLERLLQKQSKMLPLHMTVIHKAEHGRSTGGGAFGASCGAAGSSCGVRRSDPSSSARLRFIEKEHGGFGVC